jgi:Tol biopolymer transport system component/DNA-binding winged helix-turn-helix (wHTH) protein
MTGPGIYQFGDVSVDPGRMAVWKSGQAVALEPKAYDVLILLLQHRDRLVSKDELLNTVWKDTFVTPNVLTRAIVQLRKAIGDDAQEGRYIETVAKRGYRFVAPVSLVDLAAEAAGQAAEVAVAPAAPSRPAARTRARTFVLAAALILVPLIVAALMLQRRPVMPVSGQIALRASDTPKRLTTRAGYDAMPSWSPDGRAVAYVSDKSGNLEIYVMALTPGSREVAITSDAGVNVEPEWSPDGEWIAYHSRRRGGVWVVPSSGGVARQVADFGSDPAWSPDSARIAFTSDAGGLVSQSELWTVGRDGSDRKPLTAVGRPVGGHRSPAWSPGGRLVAFTAARGGWDGEVWIVSVTGGRTVKVGSGEAAGEVPLDPRFDPRGGWLYWGASNPGGESQLFRVAIDPATGDARGAIEPVATTESGFLTGLSIDRNGTAAFGVTTDAGNLWAVDLAGSLAPREPVQLTRDVVRNAYPEYSRDGRVAFTQVVPGRPAATWVMNEDGSGREPLVPDVETGSPQWDAEGRRLLVLRWPLTASWVDLATRTVTPIPVKLGEARGIRLSPDARRLAYYEIEKSGVMNVFTRGLDGSGPAQVTFDREAASYPAWSPDGRSLAVEVKRGSSTGIGVVGAGGGPIEMLVDARGQSWPHSWSPDGERIAFAGERDGVWNVWEVSRRTKAARQLTHFTSAVGYVRYPAWSPSGRRIVFERQTPSAGVWTVRLP